MLTKFKIFSIAIVSFCLCSCNSEKSRMQALLVEYLGAENQEVNIVDYQVMEIITCNNIEDSISKCESKIEIINRIYIDKYQSEIEKYKQIINNNLESKARSPYYLKSDWDNINETYYGFIEEYEKKIEQRQNEIDEINTMKKQWENLIDGKDKIEEVFSKYKVNYTIDGKVSHCELNVAPGFKLFNLEKNENESN